MLHRKVGGDEAARIDCISNRRCMARGFLYPVAIIGWAGRAVLAWRLSNTIDSGFCVAALEEALLQHGKPKISAHCDASRDNAGQGSRFTGKLEASGDAISTDGLRTSAV